MKVVQSEKLSLIALDLLQEWLDKWSGSAVRIISTQIIFNQISTLTHFQAKMKFHKVTNNLVLKLLKNLQEKDYQGTTVGNVHSFTKTVKNLKILNVFFS